MTHPNESVVIPVDRYLELLAIEKSAHRIRDLIDGNADTSSEWYMNVMSGLSALLKEIHKEGDEDDE